MPSRDCRQKHIHVKPEWETATYRWEEREAQRTRSPAGKVWGGTFVVIKEQDCPLLVHAGDVDEYGSLEGFMDAVQRNTFELRDGAIRYSGPKQERIEVFRDPKKLPRVNGRPLDVDRDMVYHSPFMKRRKGENIVTVRAGDRTAIYDFDKVSVETKIVSRQND